MVSRRVSVVCMISCDDIFIGNLVYNDCVYGE